MVLNKTKGVKIMAKSEAQRQKKLVKKRQKDRARKQRLEEFIPFAMLSPKKKIHQARAYPIHECLINASWQEKGLVTILISRLQPDGNLLFGIYLVDIFCLGLKNTFCNVDFSTSRYRMDVVSKSFEDQDSEPCSVELAHHIIYGAIAYAEQFGFRPNKDYQLSQHILNGPENIPPSELEFGKNGKPLFIAGPDDNIAKIMHQLDATVGRDHYDHVCPVDPTDT
jgi:hypothetical protein